jgi:plasmid stabilization system protein ParE
VTTLTWSPEALRDLESIRAFIAQDSERDAELVIPRLVGPRGTGRRTEQHAGRPE